MQNRSDIAQEHWEAPLRGVLGALVKIPADSNTLVILHEKVLKLHIGEAKRYNTNIFIYSLDLWRNK